jgi:hypothetical protein
MDWEKPVVNIKQADYNVLHHKVFSSDDGQKLLQFWIQEFLIDMPVAKAGIDPSFAFQREGQNMFVRSIMTRKAAGLKYLKGETK